MIMYEAQLLRESGQLQEAINHLDQFEAHICDILAMQKLKSLCVCVCVCTHARTCTCGCVRMCVHMSVHVLMHCICVISLNVLYKNKFYWLAKIWQLSSFSLRAVEEYPELH